MSVATTSRPHGAGTSSGGPLPDGPTPRRVRPPSWLDLRLVLGVLLVLGSVLVGAKVIGGADSSVSVWAASGDLAAGTVLGADDVTAVPVRLDDTADAYLAAGTDPTGRVLSRAVRVGELVPRTALEDVPAQVQVALPVQAGYVPPTLDRGRLIDVYAVTAPAAGSTEAGTVTQVVSGVPVLAVSGRGEGVLSTSTTTVQVVIAVPADTAQQVLAAIGGRDLAVVVRDSVDVAATTGSAPASSWAGPSDSSSSGSPSSGTAGPSS